MNYNFYFYFIKKKVRNIVLANYLGQKNKKFKKNDNEIGSFLFNKKNKNLDNFFK